MVNIVMQVINPSLISGKKVLLRYDIDVALGKVTGYSLQVTEDFKLRAGLDTLRLCLEYASKVIIIGHIGRPFETAEDEKKGNLQDLSARPIQEWFDLHLPGVSLDYARSRRFDKQAHLEGVFFAKTLEEAAQSTRKVVLLENVRFFHGEVPGAEYHATCVSKTCDVDFAHQLAALGQVYVNEAFSAHNKGASTTIVPTLLPHAAGLHFVKEVETLLNVRNNPKKPFVAIMGGAKVKDKLPVINVLAEKADAVLVGGKLVAEIKEQNVSLPNNVMVGKLSDDGFDISGDAVSAWSDLISKAAQIVWNGPLGKFEDLPAGRQGPKNDATKKIAQMVLGSGAETVIGGGDSVAALSQYGLLQKAEKLAFVSVGGGAMLKLLSDGTLPTIEVLS